jgi:hypothetical protein
MGAIYGEYRDNIGTICMLDSLEAGQDRSNAGPIWRQYRSKSWAGQKTSRQRARRPGLKAAPPSHSREEELVTPLQAGTRVKKAQRAQAAADWQKKKLGEPEIKRNLSDEKSEPEKQKLGGTKKEQAAS